MDVRDLKKIVVTMRISQKEEEFIERAMDKMQDLRGLGASKVTKTEIILMLMNLGLKEFDRLYGIKVVEPEEVPKKKQSKK